MTAVVKKQTYKKTPIFKKLNLEEYETKIDVERTAIDKLKHQMNEVMENVAELQSDQMKVFNNRNEIRKETEELVSKIQVLEKQSHEVQQKIRELQETSVAANTKLKNLKSNLQYYTHESLEEAIKNLEKIILNEKYSRSLETRTMFKLKSLKQQKPFIDQYLDMKKSAQLKIQSSLEPLHAQNSVIRAEIQALQDKKKVLQTKMHKIAEMKAEKVKGVQKLLDEKNEIKKQINKHKQQELEIITNMNAIKREHEAAIAKQQKELQKKRQEDRKRRDMLIARENLEIELEQIERSLIDSESLLAQQLIQYVKSLMNQEPDQKQTAEIKTRKPENSSIEGIYYKKQDKNPYSHVPFDDCISGGSFKSKKEDRKNRKANINVKTNQPFAHGILILADFSKLGINPPFTVEDCSTCIQNLEQILINLKNNEDAKRESLEQQKAEILAKLEALNIE